MFGANLFSRSPLTSVCTDAMTISAVLVATLFAISISTLLSGYARRQCRAACSTSSRRCTTISVLSPPSLRAGIREMSCVKITWQAISNQPFFPSEGYPYCLASSRRKRYPQPSMSILQIIQYSLDACLLVVSKDNPLCFHGLYHWPCNWLSCCRCASPKRRSKAPGLI